MMRSAPYAFIETKSLTSQNPSLVPVRDGHSDLSAGSRSESPSRSNFSPLQNCSISKKQVCTSSHLSVAACHDKAHLRPFLS